MPNYSKNTVILVSYPFSDLSNVKVRPAVVVNSPHISQDVLIVTLTSQVSSLLEGEFVLSEWSAAGLNIATAVKRGIYTVNSSLVIKIVGKLADVDSDRIDQSLLFWLGI